MIQFEVNNLSYYYPQGNRAALKRINLEVKKGEFLLIAGESGCGKSTLVRTFCRLVPDFYGGKIKGEVKYNGISLRKLDRKEISRKIGMLFQDPDTQLLFDNVERDIAFSLENLGMENSFMRQRVGETLDLLNITNLRQSHINDLSGGQKQKVALASILACNPEIIILDEPTSQLDPVAADEFFAIIKKLNEEMGTTIIMVEHRLEKCLHIVDQVALMDNGSILVKGSPNEIVKWQIENRYDLLPAIPKIFSHVIRSSDKMPLTVKEGRKILDSVMGSTKNNKDEEKDNKEKKNSIFSLKRKMKSRGEKSKFCLLIENLNFAYKKDYKVLKDINISVSPGKIISIVGANGAGKSTLLKVIAGIENNYTGKLSIYDSEGNKEKKNMFSSVIGYLPQDTRDYFIANTLWEDIHINSHGDLARLEEAECWLSELDIVDYKNVDPRQLSIGERQRAALACLLINKPSLILLDEPSRGLDYSQKRLLGKILEKMIDNSNITIIMVSHDIEFLSEYSSHFVFMQNGEILSDQDSNRFLPGNVFYSSQAARLFNGYDSSIKNSSEAIERMQEINQCTARGIVNDK